MEHWKTINLLLDQEWPEAYEFQNARQQDQVRHGLGMALRQGGGRVLLRPENVARQFVGSNDSNARRIVSLTFR